MQIELETAEDLRSELDTNGTAQELKYVCLALEDEISALAKLPAEEMKDHPGCCCSKTTTKRRRT